MSIRVHDFYGYLAIQYIVVYEILKSCDHTPKYSAVLILRNE
jgi:hypothetical protein